jgi:hypothetical protein
MNMLISTIMLIMGYTTPYISLPPSWENRVIYYQSFEQNESEINDSKLESSEKMDNKSGGIRGKCAIPSNAKFIQLKGKALSPDKPLAVSFWWSIQKEADKNSGFGLFHLTNGKGFISNFVRSGPWCALEKPAAALQVYYLPDIQNINGIYDYDVINSLLLKPGEWHHTAIVFTAGSMVSVYTDGKIVSQTRLTGRSFSESDNLNLMILGSNGELPVALDEIIILDRPLLDEEIAEYNNIIRQMNRAGYPAN